MGSIGKWRLEEIVSKFINRWIEIFHPKQRGENTEKNNEHSLKDICDNTKGLTFVSLES